MIYPRVYDNASDDNTSNNGISWLGDSFLEDRKMCSHCKCVRLVRENKRYYRCPQCSLRFDVAQESEQVTIDRSVSLLDIKPAIRWKSNKDFESKEK